MDATLFPPASSVSFEQLVGAVPRDAPAEAMRRAVQDLQYAAGEAEVAHTLTRRNAREEMVRGGFVAPPRTEGTHLEREYARVGPDGEPLPGATLRPGPAGPEATMLTVFAATAAQPSRDGALRYHDEPGEARALVGELEPSETFSF